ncbi:MAG TPA: response regulator [Pseudoduganella sp.]
MLPPPHRVLIIDDNVVAAQAVAEHLNEQGVFAICVHNGNAALRLAPFFKAHVVLVDINMPAKDGFSVIHALKALPGGSSAIYIALTPEHTGTSCLRKEPVFEHFLQFPYSLKEILESVMGGRLMIDSAPGEGTTVRMSLPSSSPHKD